MTATISNQQQQYASDAELVRAATAYMTEYMAEYDPSHNPAHVHRVVALAHQILEAENALDNNNHSVEYDKTVVTLAALLHDIGDEKYIKTDATTATKNIVCDFLISQGANPALAQRIQTIVSNVSYSAETKDPGRIRMLLEQDGYRELAIVQDADRLDALGAVGVGRCFVFLGAQGKKHVPPGRTWDLELAVEHFAEKLLRLESMIKTRAGREMARVRTNRLLEFMGWWEEEVGGAVADTTPY
jgi:uncharacterized protein